ncbi:MAG: glutamate formimidoyltransferase [Deltaproteobacteria bacterium]|nr:glutamate formimidoyltransferase [Deltaproteobacteria bacterium]
MNPSAVVECVPNFSEGRDKVIIQAITDAIAKVSGVTLLDVDPGEATNRTVVTFVGSPDAVVEGAFRGIEAAGRLIDMRHHRGAHPRQGATDVCPFVPVRDITMGECAELARQLGERVGSALGIPVYLYEEAASRPERRNLADVRAGEYEALPDKLRRPEWAPDYGPSAWSERIEQTGATVIGARPFLIAYNVNLNTRDKRKAMKIAATVREKGMYRKDDRGEIIRDEHGVGIRDPGMFKHVKGIGWYIEEYRRCQVSVNFTNYKETPVHVVHDAIRRVADKEGVVASGGELVGMVPMEALLDAGRYYLQRQGVNPGAPDSELIATAIRSMGLDELGPFNPDERIIERRMARDGVLVSKTVRDFTDTLASDAPAPGGGSVAALCGALSTGLAAMVGQLTTGKKGYTELNTEMNEMAVAAQRLREAFLADVDADTLAFDAIMTALSMPKSTPDEKRARGKALQAATRGAIEVPLRVLERAAEALELVAVAARGNKNARSDAGVAALTAEVAAEGAWYNVLINLSGLRDEALREAYRLRADAALEAALDRSREIRAQVRLNLTTP